MTLTEVMAELAEAGCVGFSQAGRVIQDTQTMLRAMQYARTFDFTVWLQPQDPQPPQHRTPPPPCSTAKSSNRRWSAPSIVPLRPAPNR